LSFSVDFQIVLTKKKGKVKTPGELCMAEKNENFNILIHIMLRYLSSISFYDLLFCKKIL
jgi:hypothetical protein